MLLSLAFLDVSDPEWIALASGACWARSLRDYEIEDPCRSLAVYVEEFDQDSYRVLPEDVGGKIIAQVTLIVERISLPFSRGPRLERQCLINGVTVHVDFDFSGYD
jgi:hypothetical protein